MSRKKLAAAILVIFALTGSSIRAWGEEAEKPLTITISSEIYEDMEWLPEEPNPFYVDENGIEYELETFKQVTVREETRREEIQKEITYSQLEFQTEIPQTADVIFYDEKSGFEVTENCSLQHAYAVNEQWIDGFSLSMTFHGYDSDYYQLGEHLIPANDRKPEVDGLDEEILAMIGQSTEHYQIEDVIWDGEPYLDETGVLCRNALAIGKKLVKDYVALYKGEAVFPGQDGVKWEAVYRKVPKTEIIIYEESQEMPAESMNTSQITEPLPEPVSFWRLVQSSVVVTISIGTVVIIMAVLFILIYERRKKRKQRKQLQPV